MSTNSRNGTPPRAEWRRLGQPAKSATDIDSVCDSIRVDATVRRQRNEAVSLGYYLGTVPGLAAHPVLLDTAIRAVLHDASLRGFDADVAALDLKRAHPDLVDAIELARVLDNAFDSTRAFACLVEPRISAQLPCDFGPPWRGGEHRFSLTDRIAAGANGVVYRAYDRAMSCDGRTVWAAVKVLTGLDDGAVLARREAIRARLIDHPAVARVLAAGEFETGCSFVAFEFVDGEPLRQWRASNTALSDPRAAVRFCLGIAEGIEAAHSAGVTHGDLHPGNVMVTQSGSPKIVDFGLGLLAPGSMAAGHSKGALGFMPPECWLGRQIDPRLADVYGCGALLFWIICGEPPNGKTVSEAEQWLDVGGRKRSDLVDRVRRHGADGDLANIIARALDSDPAARGPSISATISDLKRWERHEPILWSNPTLSRRAMLAVRRAPVAASLGLATVVAAIAGIAGVSMVTARGHAAVAEQAMATARAELQALRSESDQYRKARQITAAMMHLLDEAPTDRPEPRWVLLLSLLDDLMEVEGGTLAISQRRIEKQIALATQMRDVAYVTDGECSMAAVLWDTAIGRLQLESSQWDQAVRVLEPALGRARMYFGADPMTLRVQALHDAALVLGSNPKESDAEAIVHATARLRVTELDDIPAQLHPLLRQRLASLQMNAGLGELSGQDRHSKTPTTKP